jgi:hypothetical protein
MIGVQIRPSAEATQVQMVHFVSNICSFAGSTTTPDVLLTCAKRKQQPLLPAGSHANPSGVSTRPVSRMGPTP